MMSRRARMAVRIFAVTLFSVLAPVTVLYALGYRYDAYHQSVQRIAFLLAETSPRNASVFLDEALIGTQTPARAHAVEPGVHTVRIENEDAFPWTKRLSFVGGLATRIQHVTLFLREPLKHSLYDQPLVWSDQHTQFPLGIAVNARNELLQVTSTRVTSLLDAPLTDAQLISLQSTITWHPTQHTASALLDPTTAIFLEEDQEPLLMSLPLPAIFALLLPSSRETILFLTEAGELYEWTALSDNPPTLLTEDIQHIVLTDRELLAQTAADDRDTWNTLALRDLPIYRERTLSPLNPRSLPTLESIDDFTSPVSVGWFHTAPPSSDQSESLTIFDGQRLYLDSDSDRVISISHLSTYPPSESAHTFGFIEGVSTSAITYNELPTTFTYDKTNLPHSDAAPTTLQVGQRHDIHRLSRPARAIQWHPFATSIYTLYSDKLVISEIDTRDGRETYSYDLESLLPDNVDLFLCDDIGQCALATENGVQQWTLYQQ